ncbi:unnamed protein product [Arabidopsis lyrata]|nr:unnamed protein product [Arabidopsis lyrata]
MWVLVVVSRYIRELKIYSSHYEEKQNILPSSLYTCKSLVFLKLDGGILLDVPRMVSLPSLKTLELKDVIFFNEASLQRLLSNCPVLEDLLVALYYHENMEKLTVIVPSLHRLSLYIWYNCEFFIDTPSLEYFTLADRSNSSSYLIENMPKLMEAYVIVTFADIKSLIGSITSVKRLTISSKVGYGDGFIFNHLEHLTLYVGKEYSSNLLVRFLKDSPNLRELMLHSITDDHENTDMFSGINRDKTALLFLVFPATLLILRSGVDVCLRFLSSSTRFEFLKDSPNLREVEYFSETEMDDNYENFGMFSWNQPSTVSECKLLSLQNFTWSQYLGRPQDRDIVVNILKNARRLRTATIDSYTCLVPELEMIKELTRQDFSSFPVQLYEAWLLFLYAGLAMRENILRANGSDIRPWWLYHHYCAMAMALVSLTWEIKGQPNCVQKQRGVHLFLQWAMMQGVAMLLQNRYQRQRLYTRIALGKAKRLDVVWGETAGVDGQLWLLCPILFILQVFEAYVGLLLLRKTVTGVVNEWQVMVCGILLVVMAVGTS